MKFYLDTARLDEIRAAHELGVLAGVTTNPTLMAKVGITDIPGHYRTICDYAPHVSAEVIATETDLMISEGQALADLHRNIVVKIPMIEAGVRAIAALSADNIRVNCTLIFSPMQALVAARAGAAYVSPFVGRLDDAGHDGLELVRQIREIFDVHAISCEIISASIRHPQHALQSALAGAHIGTMPWNVLTALMKHPLTDVGLERFLNDYRQAFGE